MTVLSDELVVDLFAGGGGASTGIEAALERPIDIAINHSPAAIAMHAANHPRARHYCENVWRVDPAEACAGRTVGLLWASPDCTHFSRAKGGKPREKRTRSLAWVAIRWARAVRPRVIALENVEEFADWGPLDSGGMPDPRRLGLTFRVWLGKLRALGYRVEHRSLVAADYGAPTTRRRLFLVARCDGQPIAWPEPTHGKGRALPWRMAAEIIDWSLPCPSIFGRVRPLAEATMRRIAEGVRRYVIESASPFIVPLTHHDRSNRARSVAEPLPTITGAHRGELALIAPYMIPLNGEDGHAHPRCRAIDEPVPTVLASTAKHALVAPIITKHYSGVLGHRVDRPLGTVTAWDHHSLTMAFLTKFYGTSTASGVQLPLPTITANGRGGGHLGLVMVRGEAYRIVDIGMRMLQPRELFAAQGFDADYQIAPELDGWPLSKTAQIELAGNSVCPPVARAIVAANFWQRAAEVA